jgi:hypothetical protein
MEGFDMAKAGAEVLTAERGDAKKTGAPLYCNLPPVPVRPFTEIVDPNRASLIRYIEKKWVNFTVLHYYFLDEPLAWRGPEDQKQAVRQAFKAWKDLGIGLEFKEVKNARDAEIRIGFEPGGSWSYVGRDCIDLIQNPKERTMNFGWSLTATSHGRDTALHEIGHALGFPHEHQNPQAGIVWDEDKVFEYFSGPPNNWDRGMIEHNIIRKLSVSEVQGSVWDKDSVMHYQFDAGLIKKPEGFRTQPLIPAGGLSTKDIAEARKFYPAAASALPGLTLVPFESRRIEIAAGEQLDFKIKPELSRSYTIQTFGAMDTVLVLFEMIGEEPRYLDGDDDSGTERNACLNAKLLSEREYILRLRLYQAQSAGEGAIMLS